MTNLPSDFPPPPIGNAPSRPECLKPGCRNEPAFGLTRRDVKIPPVRHYSCEVHTDLFHELVLAVKYGNWQSATIERFSAEMQRSYLDELMRRRPTG